MKHLDCNIIFASSHIYLNGEALDCILVNNYTNWGFIVLDDGSSDNTETEVKSYREKISSVSIPKLTENKPKRTNVGKKMKLNIASDNFEAFLNADGFYQYNGFLSDRNRFQENKKNESKPCQ